jgi:hypothetical protein
MDLYHKLQLFIPLLHCASIFLIISVLAVNSANTLLTQKCRKYRIKGKKYFLYSHAAFVQFSSMKLGQPGKRFWVSRHTGLFRLSLKLWQL